MKAKAIIKLIRPHNCVLAGIGVLIGGIIAVGGIPPSEIGFAFVAAFFIAAGGNAVNDYADREVDAVNNPERPIPSGEISPYDALFSSRILFAVGIIYGALTWRVSCLVLAVINSALLSYYSRRLKKKGLIGNVTISYLVGSTFLFGSLAVGRFETVGIMAAMAAFATAGRELVKDIEDVRGDKESGSESFPLKHGKKQAAGLAIIFTMVAISLTPLPYVFDIFGNLYLYIVTVPVLFFVMGMGIIGKGQDKKAASRASLAYKAGMGLGLFAFLLGSFL